MPSVASILADFASLSTVEKNAVRNNLLYSSVSGTPDMDEFIKQVRFSDGRICPMCRGKDVIRHGHQKDGTQRYYCKDCKKTFVITSNSIASGTRFPLRTWEQFIDCMMISE